MSFRAQVTMHLDSDLMAPWRAFVLRFDGLTHTGGSGAIGAARDAIRAIYIRWLLVNRRNGRFGSMHLCEIL